MRLKKLRQQRAEAFAKIEAFRDKIVNENRAMTDAERVELVALEAAHKALSDDIAAEERIEAMRAASAPLASDPDADAVTAAAPSSTTSANAAGGTGGVVIVGQDRTVLAPGFFGRQLQAVMRFAANGGHVAEPDRRLLQSMMVAGPTGMGSTVPADGGFLVDQDRSSGVVQRMYETGAVLSRVTAKPISPDSDGIKLPAIDETSRADNSRYGGIVSGWLGQGNTLSAGKPKFRIMDLSLKKVGAFVYVTDELLKDARALEAWINRYLPMELTFRTEDAVLNGTGAGQPLGYFNGGCTITVTRAVASHVNYADILAMWSRMWAPSRSNAVWLVDQSVEPDLYSMSLAVGTGGSAVFMPAGGASGSPFATLFGRPIIPVEYCANLGTSGDIALVDLSQYTVIDKGGVEQAVSIHVAFLTDEQVFRFIYRVDGQPQWNAALTPKSAGNTLSPLVVLN